MQESNRRSSERLRLDKPILAMVGRHGALILDLGMEGVLVEHYGTFERGDRFTLRFPSEAGDIEYVCTVALLDDGAESQ